MAALSGSKVRALAVQTASASEVGLPPLSLNRHRGVAAVLAPPMPSKLEGFDQIGEPVFEVDNFKAWKNVAVTLGSVALGYALLAVSPWYLYPFVYAYLGTAVTGLFVIGHDCGHNSFSNNQLVNDIVGTVMMAPLIYPFEPWRIKHNTHHAHTNKLIEDTAWQPFRPFQYDRGSPIQRFAMKIALGPTWWIASIGHWYQWHFDLNLYRPQEKQKVIVSLAAVAAFAAFVLVPLLVTQGVGGFVKWWFLPFLGFHFWMSTFTLVHHTAPHIPFKGAREWNQTKAQLGGTVHCDYPSWIEFLCHDISVHIPHHLSTKIPSYNLRKAHASLEENWNKYLNKARFGIPLMSTILNNCNLFDTGKGRYVKFDKSQRV
ncbi:hypothetical protein CBR_g63073 [Chara braunii]|uniref:Fatty acid desaturase domain-containing protein n=1 Tax=Chara braunii TaxID=69332 RepID=A0A388K8Y6_CHABU|nr:hypothetical protein CBR_g63073 [Chara braunii]|eukprot:GBG66491.1 hypothetical protein CBR_g63073 [Chara braunii]